MNIEELLEMTGAEKYLIEHTSGVETFHLDTEHGRARLENQVKEMFLLEEPVETHDMNLYLESPVVGVQDLDRAVTNSKFLVWQTSKRSLRIHLHTSQTILSRVVENFAPADKKQWLLRTL